MFAAFERLIAGRYLRSRRRESFISVIALFALIGIALGVATLIIVMSVMNGFRIELVGKILGVNGHANAIVYANAVQPVPVIVARLRETPEVQHAAPMVEGFGLLRRGNRAEGTLGVVIRGYTPEDLASKPVISDSVVQGALQSVAEGKIAIGRRLATQVNARIDDWVTLISPVGAETPFGSSGPVEKDYQIGAIFDVGMSEYDGSFVFLELEQAQALFNKPPGQVTAIELFIRDADQIEAMLPALTTALQDQGVLRTWKDLNQALVTALETERSVMFLILSLIIIVAAFNIITGQIMLVKDKGRDIAILRTMGATRGMIQRVFLITGASIGILGTLIGFGLGLMITFNIDAIKEGLESLTGGNLFNETIYFLSRLPAKVDWPEVAMILVLAILLSILSSLYPAWRAARIEPVEALRNE